MSSMAATIHSHTPFSDSAARRRAATWRHVGNLYFPVAPSPPAARYAVSMAQKSKKETRVRRGSPFPLRAIPNCHMLGSEEAVWAPPPAPVDDEPSTSSAPSEPRYGEADGPRGERPRKSRLYCGHTAGGQSVAGGTVQHSTAGDTAGRDGTR